jgi:hypothetical protein
MSELTDERLAYLREKAEDGRVVCSTQEFLALLGRVAPAADADQVPSLAAEIDCVRDWVDRAVAGEMRLRIRRICDAASVIDWAEHHPEKALSAWQSAWANAGRGFREKWINWSYAIARARDAAKKESA